MLGHVFLYALFQLKRETNFTFIDVIKQHLYNNN